MYSDTDLQQLLDDCMSLLGPVSLVQNESDPSCDYPFLDENPAVSASGLPACAITNQEQFYTPSSFDSNPSDPTATYPTISTDPCLVDLNPANWSTATLSNQPISSLAHSPTLLPRSISTSSLSSLLPRNTSTSSLSSLPRNTSSSSLSSLSSIKSGSGKIHKPHLPQRPRAVSLSDHHHQPALRKRAVSISEQHILIRGPGFAIADSMMIASPSSNMAMSVSAADVAAATATAAAAANPSQKPIHPAQQGKPLKCPAPGCFKSYKNRGGLKYHVEHKHPEILGTGGSGSGGGGCRSVGNGWREEELGEGL
ncbi:hypothetical protein HDU98_009561 [Podochytrium sp. JEL0797]|nr:hypothetical protein HDU98_009561 [Podochytrium sp. JEL0797]